MVVLEETFVPELESKAQALINTIKYREINYINYKQKVVEEARKIAWDAGQRFVFREDIIDAERVIKAQYRIQAIKDHHNKSLAEKVSLKISKNKLHRYIFLEDVIKSEELIKRWDLYGLNVESELDRLDKLDTRKLLTCYN